jgi:hypothetical protein
MALLWCCPRIPPDLCSCNHSQGELADEITNLVEAPTPVMGTFDADFLSLPREVLVMVMRKHQRYFPVEDPATGVLMPYFVTLANGDVQPAVVQEGNEAVRAGGVFTHWGLGFVKPSPSKESRPGSEIGSVAWASSSSRGLRVWLETETGTIFRFRNNAELASQLADQAR